MARKNSRNTKGRIVSAAWKLFFDQGYENTTVEDIIAESGTSKGSFYHYFEGKDSLLGTLSILFDEKYEELQQAAEEMEAIDALIFLNRELFTMIDRRIPLELLARLLSSQLVTRGNKHLLNRSRTYFKLLQRIIRRGQEEGQLRDDLTTNEIVKGYAMFERALMYDWCLVDGEYALAKYAANMMPTFLEGYRRRIEK